jgi:hypothetical protein
MIRLESIGRTRIVPALLALAWLAAAARCSSGGAANEATGGAAGGVVVGAGGNGGRTGGTGGAGAAGQNGGLGGAPGAGGTTVASCSGCNSNQICVNGACMNLPSQCPCPVESYCDLGTNQCVVGCTSNDQCATGRACNTTTRTCIDGCRDDASCGAGNICDNFVCRAGCRQQSDCGAGSVCLNTVCQVGCATTSDCTATGQTCVNNACTCPASQMACNNACTPVDTVQNCGTCGNACAQNYACTGGACTCPAGTCQPQMVYSSANLQTFWVDGGFIYTQELSGSGATETFSFQRVPVAGGTSQPVATLPTGSWLEGAKVAGGWVVFIADQAGAGSAATIYTVPGAGGTPSMVQQIGVESGGLPKTFGTDGTTFYWFTYDQYATDPSMADTLWKGTLSTGKYTNVATYYDEGVGQVFVQGATAYIAGSSTNGSNGSYYVQTYNGSTLGSLFSSMNGYDEAMTMDSTGFYTSVQNATTMKEVLTFTPINGKNPVMVASEGGRNLSADSTQLYYTSTDNRNIRRVAKAGGGTPQTFLSNQAGIGAMTVNGGYVYFKQGTSVMRLATTFQP